MVRIIAVLFLTLSFATQSANAIDHDHSGSVSSCENDLRGVGTGHYCKIAYGGMGSCPRAIHHLKLISDQGEKCIADGVTGWGAHQQPVSISWYRGHWHTCEGKHISSGDRG